MTLRSRFFAMTYDRQMTKVEKAGLRAYREGLLAGAAGHPSEKESCKGSALKSFLRECARTATLPMRFREQCCYDGVDVRAVRSQPSRVLVVEEVMLMCHHVARFDFVMAPKGHARPCNEVCFWLLILPHALRKQTGRKPGNFNLDGTESDICRSVAVS